MFSIASRFSLTIIITISLTSFISAQYTRSGDTITRKNNRLIIDKSGFPAQLFAQNRNATQKSEKFSNGMTTEAIHFHIVDSATHKDIKFSGSGVAFTPVKNKNIPLTWEATNTAPSLEMKVEGLLHQKGNIIYKVTIRALQNISLADVKFHLPLVIEKAQVVQGLGRKGVLSDTVKWKWTGDPQHDIHSTTNINAGDGSITLSALTASTQAATNLPVSWANEGKGGIWLGIKGKSMLEEIYSGTRNLQKGEELHYNFSVTIQNRL